MALSSRFDALLKVLDDDLNNKVKVLGFWGCNLTTSKVEEIF
jgi:hypothetical protein